MQEITAVHKLSDDALYDLCRKYGTNAKVWLRKFAMLLPEVHKRGLYRRKRFSSIHEFSACLSGMNYATTDQILSLFRALEDKPILCGLVEEYGWSKVRVVASISSSSTDAFWAEKVKLLSKGALEVYVRGLKEQEAKKMLVAANSIVYESTQNETGGICQIFPGEKLQSVKNTKTDFLAQNPSDFNTENMLQLGQADRSSLQSRQPSMTTISIRLDETTEFRLRLMKQKLEKKVKQEITFGEVIKYIMNEMEAAPEQKERKEQTQALAPAATPAAAPVPIHIPPPRKTFSRYIPACIRKELAEKYRNRCAYPGCKLPAEVIHHSERFAIMKTHDARTMKPLCKHHHDLAHAELIENEQAHNSQDWSLSRSQSPNKPINAVNAKYMLAKNPKM